MIRAGLAALMLLPAVPAWAQATSPAAVAPAVTASAPDPARLAAARALIDTLMPPALRDRMVEDMMRPTMTNMRQVMMQSPQMRAMMADDPRVQAIFDRFIDTQLERVTGTVRKGLPGMVDAMSRAYARRFTLAQLGEIGAFFATPTGLAYVQQAPTIMADPDVAAWTRTYMTEAMADMPRHVEAMVRELSALEKDKK